MDNSDKFAAIGLGALGGGVVAFAVWQYMKVQVDAQVQTSVRTAVDTEIDSKMAQVGITPAVAAQINTLVSNLDRLGVLSTLAQSTAPPTSSSGTRGRR